MKIANHSESLLTPISNLLRRFRQSRIAFTPVSNRRRKANQVRNDVREVCIYVCKFVMTQNLQPSNFSHNKVATANEDHILGMGFGACYCEGVVDLGDALATKSDGCS